MLHGHLREKQEHDNSVYFVNGAGFPQNVIIMSVVFIILISVTCARALAIHLDVKKIRTHYQGKQDHYTILSIRE